MIQSWIRDRSIILNNKNSHRKKLRRCRFNRNLLRSTSIFINNTDRKPWKILCRECYMFLCELEFYFPLHSKNGILTVEQFRSLWMDFLLKIVIRGNPLTVEVFSFQVLSFYCQSLSFGLEIKSFVVWRKYNFDVKRKQILWYNVPIRNIHKPNFDKSQYSFDHFQ